MRLPFRFGAVTLTRCPQLFVRATVRVDGGPIHFGHAAELMVPKWFDKRVHRSFADNVRDLADSLRAAASAYGLDAEATSAFGLFERHYAALAVKGKDAGHTALGAGYGQAVLDRAVIDALCRGLGMSFFDAVRSNALGLAPSPLAPELRTFDWNGWLRQRPALTRIEARHTVGLLDDLTGSVSKEDGLPIGLRAVIERYGHRKFKIKLGGDPSSDLDRVESVLQVLDNHAPGFAFSLDGNEQYKTIPALTTLAAGLRERAGLRDRARSLLYLEQPVDRDASFERVFMGESTPLLLDEGDGSINSFTWAREAGWRGVSSKGCKGIYKALINRARCDLWNSGGHGQPYFMSAEDLSCQAGVAVQQDLAIAAVLGLGHAERNGHHYGRGLADAPDGEASAFAVAHPDLYNATSGVTRLRIEDGSVAVASLQCNGFAYGAELDFDVGERLEACLDMI